uniref:Uncharacterized protein n=1 Tax=Timema tahoe TaxID=61484 RepID=A0A7R9FKF5_9NEOP|nr:unnamed protein product [Timema tahoe]
MFRGVSIFIPLVMLELPQLMILQATASKRTEADIIGVALLLSGLSPPAVTRIRHWVYVLKSVFLDVLLEPSGKADQVPAGQLGLEGHLRAIPGARHLLPLGGQHSYVRIQHSRKEEPAPPAKVGFPVVR